MEKRKRIVSIDEAPSFLVDSPHLRHGYRLHHESIADCVLSLFTLHNETLNVWSHLVAAVYCGLLFSDLHFDGEVSGSFAHQMDLLMVSIATAASVFTFILSAVFHLFCCMSADAHRTLLILDLLGVLSIILSFYFSGLYFGFYFHPAICLAYMLSVAAMSALAVAAAVVPWMRANRPLRSLIFALLAASGFLPMAHWMLIRPAAEVVAFLSPFLTMYALLGLGFFFFITHIPERFFPASQAVSVLCSSHTLWHVLVAFATAQMYYVALGYSKHVQMLTFQQQTSSN